MKKIFIAILVLVNCTFAVAQTKGYKCIYQQNMSFQLDKNNMQNEEMAELIAKALGEMKIMYNLTFADGKSLWELDKKNSGNMFTDNYSVIYTDINTNKKIRQEKNFGKTFLIADTMADFNWTITEETKMINGRMCIKAVSGDTNQTTEKLQGEIKDLDDVDFTKVMQSLCVAWFCPEIPIPCGPMGFAGLPGLIVQIELGDLSYTLENIETVSDMPEIKPPAKGKKITEKEYGEFVKKKVKELQSNGFRPFDDDDNGGFHIIMGH